MSNKNKRVGVLLGGMSSERDISFRTGRAIAKALRQQGYDTVEIDADSRLGERLLAEKIDVAMIALHGPFGEDGCVQGLLEIVRIPYTGSGVLASAVAMDKRMTKELLAFRGIPTPPWIEVRTSSLAEIDPVVPFDFPVVVKPVAEGSTVGIHIVNQKEQLREALEHSGLYGERLLIEAYIPGMEVTVGVVDGKALPVIEIVPRSGFYDFTAKYTAGETTFHLPARIAPELESRCRELGVQTFEALECRGVARVDIRIDPEGRCFVLEVNTIPGMTETSLIPKAAAHMGITFEQLCEQMVEGACLKVTRKK